jgi:tetratricopeptide (TPR) repeat protein
VTEARAVPIVGAAAGRGSRARCLPLWAAACWLAGSAVHAQSEDAEKTRARECFSAAQEAYLAGRLDDARKGFECAYARLPSPELLWNLARVCERMGDVEHGVRYYRDYLTQGHVSPRERKGIEGRIRALLDLEARQSAHLNASADARAALSGEARTFYQRGVKLYRTGHFEAAAAAFTQALQLSDAPELHYNLAKTSQQLGSVEEAYDHYRAYLAALPDAPDRLDVETRIAELRAQLP